MTSFQAMICIYLLKLEWEEVLLTMIKDTVKPVINTWNFTMIVNQVSTSCIWMQIIFMAGQSVNVFLTINLND